jgi:hypothetical protein
MGRLSYVRTASMTTCKNCKNEFDGAYCNQCGQAAFTPDVNLSFLRQNLVQELIPLDKGILFTLRGLFTRPGYIVREYLKGKRVQHVKPLSLVLVLAGIFGFLVHYFKINLLSGALEVTGTSEGVKSINTYLDKVNNWVGENYALVCLVQLPIYAFGTFVMFRRKGYNYAEHFILNAFLTGQRLLLRIVLFPVYYMVNTYGSTKGLSSVIGVAGFLLAIWTLGQFFDQVKKWGLFWRTVMSYVIFYVIFISLTTGVAVLMYLYVIKTETV